jgi:hypothetical protein
VIAFHPYDPARMRRKDGGLAAELGRGADGVEAAGDRSRIRRLRPAGGAARTALKKILYSDVSLDCSAT